MTAYNMSSIVPDSSYPAKWSVGTQQSIEFQYTLGGAVVTGDTFTTPASATPSGGFRILEVELISPELDTNATPTGTISIGDTTSATRFVNAAPMGVNGITTTGYQMSTKINQAQTLSSGVVSAGSNYLYGVGTSPQFVITLGGTIATAQTAGVLRLRVTYRCVEEN